MSPKSGWSRVLIAVGILVLGIVAIGVLGFAAIGAIFEPLAPFARSEKAVTCNDGSSVVFYKRKVGWFTEGTQLSVQLFDKRGNVVRTNSIGTFSHWVDSEMKVLENPEMFCDPKRFY